MMFVVLSMPKGNDCYQNLTHILMCCFSLVTEVIMHLFPFLVLLMMRVHV